MNCSFAPDLNAFEAGRVFQNKEFAEKSIEQIREQIRKSRVQSWELPKWTQNLNDDKQDELQDYFNDVEAEAYEWVLREIFQVTP